MASALISFLSPWLTGGEEKEETYYVGWILVFKLFALEQWNHYINMKMTFIETEHIVWSWLLLSFFLCSVFNFVDVRIGSSMSARWGKIQTGFCQNNGEIWLNLRCCHYNFRTNLIKGPINWNISCLLWEILFWLQNKYGNWEWRFVLKCNILWLYWWPKWTICF